MSDGAARGRSTAVFDSTDDRYAQAGEVKQLDLERVQEETLRDRAWAGPRSALRVMTLNGGAIERIDSRQDGDRRDRSDAIVE